MKDILCFFKTDTVSHKYDPEKWAEKARTAYKDYNRLVDRILETVEREEESQFEGSPRENAELLLGLFASLKQFAELELQDDVLMVCAHLLESRKKFIKAATKSLRKRFWTHRKLNRNDTTKDEWKDVEKMTKETYEKVWKRLIENAREHLRMIARVEKMYSQLQC